MVAGLLVQALHGDLAAGARNHRGLRVAIKARPRARGHSCRTPSAVRRACL